VRLSAEYRKVGATVNTDKGNVVQHPILGAKNKASERILKFAAHFGMTPAARAKLEVRGNEDEDEFAKFAGLSIVGVRGVK
jgi:P27 family predicted phage terminase small subunit